MKGFLNGGNIKSIKTLIIIFITFICTNAFAGSCLDYRLGRSTKTYCLGYNGAQYCKNGFVIRSGELIRINDWKDSKKCPKTNCDLTFFLKQDILKSKRLGGKFKPVINQGYLEDL